MDDQGKRAGMLTGGQVTRREVLKKGLIGAAGLTVLPAVIAACSTASSTPTTAPVVTPAPTTVGPVTPPPSTAPAGLTEPSLREAVREPVSAPR